MTRLVRQLLMLVVLLAGSTVATPGALSAQGGDGFLFKQPRVALKFETGYGWQAASSDIFDWVIAEHTLDRRDFDAPYLGAEVAVRVSEQVDLALSFGYQSRSTQSEYRDFVGTDDLPILQTTTLKQMPAVASLKFYPVPRGRQIGSFAWIPSKLSPFIGGGVGLVGYNFVQDGEFVDYTTSDIFNDRVVSKGTAFLARAQAGVDVALGKQFVLSLEGRYNWAENPLQGGFVGFEPIDLNGMQAIAGIAVRF